jgi:hypothetical protein
LKLSPAAKMTVPGAIEKDKRKPPVLVRKLERHGAAAQHTVAFLKFLSSEACAVQWLVPNTTATPHQADTLQKPEQREW